MRHISRPPPARISNTRCCFSACVILEEPQCGEAAQLFNGGRHGRLQLMIFTLRWQDWMKHSPYHILWNGWVFSGARTKQGRRETENYLRRWVNLILKKKIKVHSKEFILLFHPMTHSSGQEASHIVESCLSPWNRLCLLTFPHLFLSPQLSVSLLIDTSTWGHGREMRRDEMQNVSALQLISN